MFEDAEVDDKALDDNDEELGEQSTENAVGASPAAATHTASLMSGDTCTQVEHVPKAKPGAKWNRQRAIAQVCTGWSAAMVDLHGEVIKTFASQSETD